MCYLKFLIKSVGLALLLLMGFYKAIAFFQQYNTIDARIIRDIDPLIERMVSGDFQLSVISDLANVELTGRLYDMHSQLYYKRLSSIEKYQGMVTFHHHEQGKKNMVEIQSFVTYQGEPRLLQFDFVKEPQQDWLLSEIKLLREEIEL